MLIAPGASLGGARPKASIIDNNRALWIAKFPSRNDQGDIGGWEIVTHELVEFIMNNGASVAQDLEELWRRIVFSICVSNTDDHLRNHGFILTEKGWLLSPAFDINPVETGTGLKLNISEQDNSLDLDLVMEVHEFFMLSESRAAEIFAEVKSAVRNWKKVADKYGIPRVEQQLKALAFRQAETK